MANNKDLDAKDIEARVLDLYKSMERMKANQADRDDVVVELKQSQRTRLEMLARDLQPVFDQVPDENDQFEFALTNGDTPRLWIDMSAHVRMGADKRQFELVKDTRMGRTILATSNDMGKIGQVVTDYVADKILERERLIEGEWVAMSGYNFDGAEDAPDNGETVSAKRRPFRSFGLFLLGALVGIGALFAWAWFGQLPGILQ